MLAAGSLIKFSKKLGILSSDFTLFLTKVFVIINPRLIISEHIRNADVTERNIDKDSFSRSVPAIAGIRSATARDEIVPNNRIRLFDRSDFPLSFKNNQAANAVIRITGTTYRPYFKYICISLRLP